MRTSLRTFALVLVAGAVVTAGAQANGSPYSPGLVQGPQGVLDAVGSVRYVALGTERWTVVAAIRERDGLVQRTRTLRGFYGVPLVAYDGTTGGLSGNGRTLVVASYGPYPGQRGTTRFAVLGTRTLRPSRTIRLAGAWSYDASSPDGRALFLVQHLSAGESPRYRVRAYDVERGLLLREPIVDRLGGEAVMGGQPATRETSPDGRWVYTLYARAEAEPFVHALDTVKREAYCIDLPLRLGQGKQMDLRLELDGPELVVRSGLATVAVVDTRTFEVRRS
jgi:hypothetical protein